MKTILIALLLAFAPLASGSSLSLVTIVQPVYLHGSESDSRITFQAVPFVTFHSAPEWSFTAISTPFIPPTDGTWKPHDVNLASLYKITVSGGYKDNQEEQKDILVTIDASKAVVPEGHPFTVEQVIDAVVTCVKMAYPARPVDEGTFEIEILRPKKAAAKAGKK